MSTCLSLNVLYTTKISSTTTGKTKIHKRLCTTLRSTQKSEKVSHCLESFQLSHRVSHKHSFFRSFKFSRFTIYFRSKMNQFISFFRHSITLQGVYSLSKSLLLKCNTDIHRPNTSLSEITSHRIERVGKRRVVTGEYQKSVTLRDRSTSIIFQENRRYQTLLEHTMPVFSDSPTELRRRFTSKD